MRLSYRHVNTSVSAAILLLAFLLAPLDLQAQSIVGFAFYQGADFSTGARLSLTGNAEHFPARITLDWGDGKTSWGNRA